MHKPERPARIHQGKFILIDVMRDANNAAFKAAVAAASDDEKASIKPLSGLQPAALEAQGIDPKAFQKVMAFTFAFETLNYHDNQPSYQEVLVSRCRQCLDEKEEFSFGHFISDEMKNDLRRKLERNGVTGFDLTPA